MKYLIFYKTKEAYYSDNKNNHWVKNISEGLKFQTKEKAENLIKGNFTQYPSPVELEVIPENRIPDDVPLENPEETFEDFKNVTNLFVDYASKNDKMIAYFSQMLSHYDLAQEDILHKIEFSSISGIFAVRLVKQLKEIRIKRREVKNALDFLKTIKDSKVENIVCNVNSFSKRLENKTYNPRVLKELFE